MPKRVARLVSTGCRLATTAANLVNLDPGGAPSHLAIEVKTGAEEDEGCEDRSNTAGGADDSSLAVDEHRASARVKNRSSTW